MARETLSIFVDESGDFGSYEPHAPYYIVSFVAHDQSASIAKYIENFDEYLINLGFSNHAVHIGPLIRRESVYKNEHIKTRARLFHALFNLVIKMDIKYTYISIQKDESMDTLELNAKISKEMAAASRAYEDYFKSFKKIIVYYDNGQNQLNNILTSVFSTMFENVEFRRVMPVDYKLFQVADLICTMALLHNKYDRKTFSHSELDFFGSYRDFNKNYLKKIIKKRL